MRGIDRRTSRMRSEQLYHSSYIPISSVCSNWVIKLPCFFWVSSPLVCFSLVGMTSTVPMVPTVVGNISSFGDAGYRSPYLSHATRALYHLSYIPIRSVCSNWVIKLPCFILISLPQVSLSLVRYNFTDPNVPTVVGWNVELVDAGYRSQYLSHAKRTLYHFEPTYPYDRVAQTW